MIIEDVAPQYAPGRGADDVLVRAKVWASPELALDAMVYPSKEAWASLAVVWAGKFASIARTVYTPQQGSPSALSIIGLRFDTRTGLFSESLSYALEELKGLMKEAQARREEVVSSPSAALLVYWLAVQDGRMARLKASLALFEKGLKTLLLLGPEDRLLGEEGASDGE